MEASSIVGDVAQDASRKACPALEDETPVGELPRVDKESVEATGVPPPWARQASSTVHSARRPPNRLVLSSYIEPMEWARPTEDEPTLDQETTRALINYWGPFN